MFPKASLHAQAHFAYLRPCRSCNRSNWNCAGQCCPGFRGARGLPGPLHWTLLLGDLGDGNHLLLCPSFTLRFGDLIAGCGVASPLNCQVPPSLDDDRIGSKRRAGDKLSSTESDRHLRDTLCELAPRSQLPSNQPWQTSNSVSNSSHNGLAALRVRVVPY